MTGLRLYKKEKLCSKIAIDTLFSPSARKDGGNICIMAYPWRAVARHNPSRSDDPCAKFLISVPKKRLRRAVDRVRMRRRMREAFRLNRHLLTADHPLDIAIIYVADSLTDYTAAVNAISKIFRKLSNN